MRLPLARRSRRSLASAFCLAILMSILPITPANATPSGTGNEITSYDYLTTRLTCASIDVETHPLSGEHALAWIDPDNNVRVGKLDADGALVGSVITGAATSGFLACDPVELVPGPANSWLVVWPLYASGGLEKVVGQILDSSTMTLSAVQDVSSNGTYSDIETATGAWSASAQRYLITWKTRVNTPFPSAVASQQIVGRFLDANGSGLAGQAGHDFLVTDIPGEIDNSQDVAVGDDSWLVVGSMRSPVNKVVGRVVGLSGPEGSVFEVSDAPAREHTWGPSVTYSPATSQFGVAFTRQTNTSSSNFMRLISASGTPVGSDIALGTDTDVRRPRIAATGATYVVVWHNGNKSAIRYATVTADGTLNDVGDISTIEGIRPSITHAGSGNLIIAWWGLDSPNLWDIHTHTFAAAFAGGVSVPEFVPPLLPTAIPTLIRADSTLTCSVGEYSEAPVSLDATLVVDGLRKETKRVGVATASTTFSYDSAWQGLPMTCEVVARAIGKVATAYSVMLTVPRPASTQPTTPVAPVLPLLPDDTTSGRGFAVDSVRFDSGSAALDSSDRSAIAVIVKRAGTTTATYRVTGYVQGASTRATGSSMSRARAEAVAAELRRLGVKPANITVRAAGGTIRNDASARRAVIEASWTK